MVLRNDFVRFKIFTEQLEECPAYQRFTIRASDCKIPMAKNVLPTPGGPKRIDN